MTLRRLLVAGSLAAIALAGTPATADEADFVTYNDGTTGAVVATTAARNSGSGEHLGRFVSAHCTFRVDTTTGNDVLMTVTGHSQAHGTPRATTAEVQCVIRNRFGATVFDMTRAESGPIGPLVGTTIIRNDGPYTVCARGDAKWDDGDDHFIVMTCVTP